MFDLPTPLAVVCHDAGAANIILSWLAAKPQRDVRPVMEGPARRLWQARFPDWPVCDTIDRALDGAAALLSGTGWSSSLEHSARKEAREMGIRSAAVIDHWVNYQARFIRDGQAVYPDEYWVTDPHALDEARRCFPDAAVRMMPNLYLAEQLARIPSLKPGRSEVLYVLEPARSDWGRNQPGEFQALDYFGSRLDALGLDLETPIRLRPHPSDPIGKYDAWIARNESLNVTLDNSADIAEAIANAEWVAGCESFALVVALEARRKVICTLPPWAPPCSLPHNGLIHLKKIA